MKFTIAEETSLLEALRLYFPTSSRRTLQNWIKWGRVFVDGILIQRANFLIKKGQILSLGHKEPTQKIGNITVLYQDRWIVVIDKPNGLLSVPAEKEEPSVLHLLKIGLKSQSLFAVHRLDQETSGTLLFVRSKLAEEKFDALFETHSIEREYLAIVEGRMPQKKGTWENYLREKQNYDVEVTSSQEGKRAVTHYEVIRCSKKFSYLHLHLETGRKHQIRVQAAHTGFPLVGDQRYGSLIDPFKRLCLHAYRLSFVHPLNHKKTVVISLPMHIRKVFATPRCFSV